jgi:hypothetical protein
LNNVCTVNNALQSKMIKILRQTTTDLTLSRSTMNGDQDSLDTKFILVNILRTISLLRKKNHHKSVLMRILSRKVLGSLRILLVNLELFSY